MEKPETGLTDTHALNPLTAMRLMLPMLGVSPLLTVKSELSEQNF